MDTPNFNEVEVIGLSWERTGRVVIENPLNGVPSMMTVEEYAEPDRNGNTRCTPFRNLHITFDLTNPKHVLLYTTINELVVEERLRLSALAEPPAE